MHGFAASLRRAIPQVNQNQVHTVPTRIMRKSAW